MTNRFNVHGPSANDRLTTFIDIHYAAKRCFHTRSSHLPVKMESVSHLPEGIVSQSKNNKSGDKPTLTAPVRDKGPLSAAELSWGEQKIH